MSEVCLIEGQMKTGRHFWYNFRAAGNQAAFWCVLRQNPGERRLFAIVIVLRMEYLG